MTRCSGAAKKGVRCLVPTDASGKHVDGNPDHYNGSSHWGPAGWVRGT